MTIQALQAVPSSRAWMILLTRASPIRFSMTIPSTTVEVMKNSEGRTKRGGRGISNASTGVEERKGRTVLDVDKVLAGKGKRRDRQLSSYLLE